MALPVSAGYQARIDTAQTGLAGLPAIFNPQRRSLAYNAAAGLNESGLTRGLDVQQVDEGGNLVYRLVRGQDGRLYSQAFRKVGDQQNARGTFFSSFNERDQRDARQQLDAQRNAAMRQFAAAEQGLTDQQAAAARTLGGDLSSARGDYADWQATQLAPDPGVPAPSANPMLTPQPGQMQPNSAGNIVTNLMRGDLSPGALSGLAQSHPGFKVVIAGNGRVVLKKMG